MQAETPGVVRAEPGRISDAEFRRFQRFIFERAGITLASSKKPLVAGRLAGRLRDLKLTSYGEYFRLLAGGKDDLELQRAVDLLTTNETYFFREPKHFERLRALATQARRDRQPLRVWSAASSSGEEPYSIAMVLADALSDSPWTVVASDISATMLERARRGHYPDSRTTHIPPDYLKRFCLKGHGPQARTLLVTRALRSHVEFYQVNLNGDLPPFPPFDVIFLRNVLIYFNPETRRSVVGRVLRLLKPQGQLFIGHSENLNDVGAELESVAPAVYRRRAASDRKVL